MSSNSNSSYQRFFSEYPIHIHTTHSGKIGGCKNGLTFCVIHFCVIHPDFQQSCTQVLCHTQSHTLCHTLFWSEFFCHTPPKQPDFLSYFMMLLLAWSMGAGTALVVHAKNSRPRRASNPHQTP